MTAVEEMTNIIQKMQEAKTNIEVGFANIMKREKEIQVEVQKSKLDNKLEDEVIFFIRNSGNLQRDAIIKKKKIGHSF